MVRTLSSSVFKDKFLHDEILAACNRFGGTTAIIDTSVEPHRNITFGEYADLVESAAKGLVAAGIKPGEVIAIYLCNSWEYAVTFHAATLAGAVPTLLNPSYREREVRYQLENSGAAMLVTDGPLIAPLSLGDVPNLRSIICTRRLQPGTMPFHDLLSSNRATLLAPSHTAYETLAALPYSSGTTGLPKGVELTHENLVANCYQYLASGEKGTIGEKEVLLGFLPLYHIYGLNVCMNPTLLAGATLLLMPRFDAATAMELLTEYGVTYLPMVPPIINLFCQASVEGKFPRDHSVRVAKSGAAPLAPELAKRFTELTGIRVRQGYGMTEASPVTHMGFIDDDLYRPDSIGMPNALTECRIIAEDGRPCPIGEPGELVMRGPQFMRGYRNAPEATASVLKEGWYWSGDIAVIDVEGFYKIVDRRKEMIKFKGFPIAPAEVEAVLMEHPAVRDCGVIGLPDDEAGEIPCAFIVLSEDHTADKQKAESLKKHVADRLTSYKQPREIRFVETIPRNPSGKILRKDLRTQI